MGEIFSLPRACNITWACIHVMYIIIIICEGRAGYKLCKIMLSSSDSTMEVRGECICRCYVRNFTAYSQTIPLK